MLFAILRTRLKTRHLWYWYLSCTNFEFLLVYWSSTTTSFKLENMQHYKTYIQNNIEIILNKKSRTADKRCSYSLWLGRGANNSST